MSKMQLLERRPKQLVIRYRAHHQDGTQAILKADKVTFSNTGEGDEAVRKGMLELYKPGQQL